MYMYEIIIRIILCKTCNYFWFYFCLTSTFNSNKLTFKTEPNFYPKNQTNQFHFILKGVNRHINDSAVFFFQGRSAATCGVSVTEGSGTLAVQKTCLALTYPSKNKAEVGCDTCSPAYLVYVMEFFKPKHFL